MKELIQFSPELAFITFAPVFLAFSLKVRKIIGERDGWHCQEEGCEKSFQKGDMVHSSHISHDRSDPDYNSPDRGEVLCVEHHKRYHEEFIGHAEDIGLEECQNDWAIEQLEKTDEKTRWWRKQKNGV